MIGAIMMPTGTPAFANVSITFKRLAGAGAHGSIVRASSASIHARLTFKLLRELRDQIDIAFDERALRDDRDRIAVLEADLETLLGQLEVFLDRLIAIRHAAEHDELALPGRLVECFAQ
jgi:hypothetical protein